MKRLLISCILLATVIPGRSDPPDPAWWSTGTPPVRDPNAISNNHGPANIGQAKFMTKRALDALRAKLPAVADQVEADLVGAGKPIPTFDVPSLPNAVWQEQQRMPLLIGQLKAIAAPFYNYLNTAAPEWLLAERQTNGTASTGTHLPWTTATADDNNRGMATIGQLKAAFALRFETVPSTPVDSDADSDGDGLLDSWELHWFGNLTSQSGDGDADGDGCTNLFEMLYGLNPTVQDASLDADQDGMSNLNEQTAGLNPMLKDNPKLLLQVTEE